MDLVLVDGDTLNCMPVFGKAVVVVKPGKLVATGTMKIGGVAVCIEGDAGQLKIMGCQYVSPPFTVPGMGNIAIKKLGADQLSKKSLNGEKLILKGALCDLEFKVTKPAQEPPPPAGSGAADSTVSYAGKGSFVASQIKLKSA